MQIIDAPEAFGQACQQARAAGRRVGLVPTMGALHRGHLSLVDEAKRRADAVAVSIFVNPTQFGPNEDLERYPRDLGGDCDKCREAGVELVFAPAPNAMYPPGDETRVTVGPTAAELCGRWRPGHFPGVATVVTKLLALTGPCVAVFGRKDYQQLRVIKRLARDLFLPAEIVGAPTVREPDGLALSSRNAYLSAAERQRALAIPRALSEAVAAFADGERGARALRERAHDRIAEAADSVDYLELADPERVEPLPPEAQIDERALLAVAARVGATRLIDNVVLGEDPAPIAAAEPRP